MGKKISQTAFNYHADYASQLLRGVDLDPRPWNIASIVLQYCQNRQKMLDVGCGTAYKTIPLHQYFVQIYGLDPSPDLLQKAQENIAKKNIKNFKLVKGVGDALPFPELHFDVVTAILSFTNLVEFKRVLKKWGIYIGEYLGANDKTELTKHFGKDEQGWRGANLNHTPESLQEKFQDDFALYFSNIKIINSIWRTKYSVEGLWILLNNTYNTIRDFSAIKDKVYFDRAMSKLSRNGEVILQQNRVLVIATDGSSDFVEAESY